MTHLLRAFKGWQYFLLGISPVVGYFVVIGSYIQAAVIFVITAVAYAVFCWFISCLESYVTPKPPHE